MTDVNHLNDTDRSVLLAHEIDDLLLRVRGLVLVRDLLAERGATRAEVDAHTDELDRARSRLALIIGGATQAGSVGGEAFGAPVDPVFGEVS